MIFCSSLAKSTHIYHIQLKSHCLKSEQISLYISAEPTPSHQEQTCCYGFGASENNGCQHLEHPFRKRGMDEAFHRQNCEHYTIIILLSTMKQGFPYHVFHLQKDKSGHPSSPKVQVPIWVNSKLPRWCAHRVQSLNTCFTKNKLLVINRFNCRLVSLKHQLYMLWEMCICSY